MAIPTGIEEPEINEQNVKRKVYVTFATFATLSKVDLTSHSQFTRLA